MSNTNKKERVAAKTAGGLQEALINALPDAVLCCDRHNNIVFSNDAAKDLFGQSLFGSDLRRIFEADSAVGDAVKSVFKSGGTVALHDLAVKDRTALTVSCGPVAGTEFFMMSLHMQPRHVKAGWAEKARAALKPAQHMARMLAHEIKNPLAGIRGAAQLLERAEASSEERELLSLIVREADRLSRLAEKVNVFDDAPQVDGTVNIHEVLGRVIQLSRAMNATVVFEESYDPSLPDIRGSFDPLVQVFLNIVKNAVEAGADRITLRSRYEAAPVYHPQHHAKLPLCVEVEDNGPGIPPESRARVFEPYFTTKQQGEGLGLAIVSKIVDDHGGCVELAGGPGRTIFKISFPMVKS